MIARARIVAEASGSGDTRLSELRSSAPLVLRRAQGAVWIVGGAAGPLGGDDLTLEGPAAQVTALAPDALMLRAMLEDGELACGRRALEAKGPRCRPGARG